MSGKSLTVSVLVSQLADERAHHRHTIASDL